MAGGALAFGTQDAGGNVAGGGVVDVRQSAYAWGILQHGERVEASGWSACGFKV